MRICAELESERRALGCWFPRRCQGCSAKVDTQVSDCGGCCGDNVYCWRCDLEIDTQSGLAHDPETCVDCIQEEGEREHDVYRPVDVPVEPTRNTQQRLF